MRTIGIAGGVASGKSVVAEQLRQLGAISIDADRIGHEVLRQTEVQREARERWGARVFSDNGEIDRRELAKIVFGGDSGEELMFWESIMFPRIRVVLEKKLADLRSQDIAAAIVDAAVMFKANWDRMCDVIIYVDAAEEVRLARARLRGWTAKQFAAREAAQASLGVKRAKADFVIDNNHSLDKTKAQTKQFWLSLDSSPKKDLPSSEA